MQIHTLAGHGTGFVIGPRRIATAAHVTTFSTPMFPGITVYFPTVTVEFQDGRKALARVAYLDKAHDVAILVLSEPTLAPALPFADSPPAYDEPLTLIGNVFNLGWVKERGRAKSIKTEDIMLTINSGPGYSGSPLLNKRGQVVGILSYMIQDGTTRYYTGAKSIDYLRYR